LAPAGCFLAAEKAVPRVLMASTAGRRILYFIARNLPFSLAAALISLPWQPDGWRSRKKMLLCLHEET